MITVYDMHSEYDRRTGKDDFKYDGLAILRPTSAYVTEELNGRYDMEIEIPCIPDDPREGRNEDSWKFVKMYNILKSSEGQLFMIHKIEYSVKNNVPYLKAYANHIWYYLADMLTLECKGENNYAWQVVNHLFEPRDVHGNGCTWFSGGTGLTSYDFDMYIDPSLELVLPNDQKYKYHFRNVQLANALLGNSDSIVNVWGGEIYRDNFYFRIDKRKYDTVDDAFELVYGVNCRDVRYTEDTTNRKTEIHTSCNGGMWAFAKSVIPDAGLFPHQAISGFDLSYSEPDEETYYQDIDAWWAENTGWIYNWEVDYVDFKDTNKGANWNQMRKIRVGDKGVVQDAFGHRQSQKVIATKYNDITGRLESIKLGSFKESGLHVSRWEKKVMVSTDNPEVKRIENVERQLGGVGGDISHITGDISNMNNSINGINNSINDINAAIQDIYSKLPQNPNP